MQAELLLDARATLGEGPAWDEKTQTLYWVDILAKRVHAWKEGRGDFLQLDEYIGCLAPRRDGGLIAALHASFWTLGLVAGKQALIASVSEPASNRFNDGKCDPAGRLLAGTMDMEEKAASGALYSLTAGQSPRKLLDGIRISNGLAWSPNYKIFYYIDTPTRQVRAFDYDLETGNISRPRVVVEIPPGMGFPDGMTSDMEGRLWIALWGGACVSKWNPLTGQKEAEIAIPAPHVTSCVFGGPRRDILFVTTARLGLDEAALAANPLSGGVFQIQTQAQGMPTFAFAG
jgi:sugar lactone lactonase YvrE